MVDANNAFDLDGTIRWLDAVDDDLFFVEEMFPERVEDDLKLKEYLKSKGWTTLVADGESAREVDHFDPYLKAGALDVLQADIRAFGLTLLWELSRRAAAAGHSALLAPHNWGSFLGVYMMVVLGRGIPNFLMAEEDTSSSDLFDTSAFVMKEGRMKVPDTPGCGLVLREDVFEARYRKEAWVVGRIEPVMRPLMKRFSTMAAFAILPWLVRPGADAAKADDRVIDVGSRRELFVDRTLIDRLDGARLRLHEPRLEGVALTFDKPWEGVFSAYITVIKDGDLYRMYYRGLADAAEEGQIGRGDLLRRVEGRGDLDETRPRPLRGHGHDAQ